MTQELEDIDGVLAGSVKSLCTVKNIAATDGGLDLAPFSEYPPEKSEEVSRVREAVDDNFMARGRLAALDGTAVVLRADLAPDHDVATVYAQARAIADKYSDPERVYLTGDTIVDHEVTSSMRVDVAFLFPAALALAVIILFAAFRRLRSVVVPSLAVVATTAASLGLMGFLGMPVTVVGTILPVVIVAVVSAYGIHIVNALNGENMHGGTSREILDRTMKTVGGPIAISAITSAIGFGSLIVFKIRSIHDFGFVLAVAILIGLCSALVFIPAVFAILLPAKESQKSRAKSDFIDRSLLAVHELVERYRRVFAGVAAAGFVLAVVASLWLKVGLEPAKFFPEGHPTRQSLDVFDERLGGSTYFNIMIDTGEPDGILNPDMLRKMDEFQQFAGRQEHVGYATSFVDVVRRLHVAFGEAGEHARELPDNKSQVAQYLLLYSISGDPTDFEDIVDYDYRRAKMVVMLNTYDDAEHLALYEKLRAKAQELFGGDAGIEFGGRAMILLAQDRYIVTGKILNIICSLLIVLVACMLYFRSASGGVLSIIPLAVSTVYTFGLMGLMGMRLNVATAMTTGVAVGVGVDFAVHYIHRFRHELQLTGDENEAVRRTLVTTGKGIIFNALSVSCGFLVFMGSRFQALRDFGWLIALTMLTCTVGTLVFLPPLIRILRPYFIYGKEPDYMPKTLSFPPIRVPVVNAEFGPALVVRLNSSLRKIAQYL
jgi:hydrophobe/amphiphile efflux-3 (HAE3) family protein